ncbi:MAG TPA: glycoside hydrolase family 2 TIM barrel-domain containing protein [Bacteroidales bacterium]|nr:glycoside hydrolase family 2 TIM barrel-domain containing protein [Bacteroidales bacterium]
MMKFKKSLVFILLTAVSPIWAMGQSSLITNVVNRNTYSLNGKWKYIVDPYETGYYDYRYQPYDAASKPWGGFFLDKVPQDKNDLVEYSFDKSPVINVPGDWNSQNTKLWYYEGSVWYRRKFDYKKSSDANRVFVHFGAANYQADVYLNGYKLGQHIGGFTPFNYEVTSLLKDKDNSLIVKVDNKRKRDGVPTLNTDWWNFGGITRDVELIEVPSTFIQDYTIQLQQHNMNNISGFVQLNGDSLQHPVTINIPELKISTTVKPDAGGRADFSISKFRHMSYWSPENPKLYDVVISQGNEQLQDQIGFRTIEARKTEILLNGKPIFLRGISLHEENPMRGARAYSEEDARTFLTWAKQLNCNFMRLAHYPHNEHMIRMAEKMGIMLWEEDPVYWTIEWDNPDTYKNAENQLTELITRDKNRANVIIWSLANETPPGAARNKFLKGLADHARSMDSTRLISAALEKHTKKGEPLVQVVEDPVADFVDVVSFNEYLGWYDGTPEKCKKVSWEIKYDKPVVISEFGGGALYGKHGDKNTRWTEEYQAELYKQNLDMLLKIPQFRGTTPWILADFHSPRRLLPDIQDEWNRKGLISETGGKKKAFFVLRDFYKRLEKAYQ